MTIVLKIKLRGGLFLGNFEDRHIFFDHVAFLNKWQLYRRDFIKLGGNKTLIWNKMSLTSNWSCEIYWFCASQQGLVTTHSIRILPAPTRPGVSLWPQVRRGETVLLFDSWKLICELPILWPHWPYLHLWHRLMSLDFRAVHIICIQFKNGIGYQNNANPTIQSYITKVTFLLGPTRKLRPKAITSADGQNPAPYYAQFLAPVWLLETK